MNKNIANIFAFILGREQKIALLELESVLRRFCFDFFLSLDGNCAIINIKNRDDDEVAGLIDHLGGTLKIYKIVAPKNNNLSNQIALLIVDKLTHTDLAHRRGTEEPEKHGGKAEEKTNQRARRRGKTNFGISNYSSERLGNGLGASVKTHLKYRRINSRYVKPKEGEVLSSAESWHNIIKKGGVEIGMFQAKSEKRKAQNYCSKLLVGELIAVSIPDEWAEKDFGKPRSDAKSGMMPPKLARMLINIACGRAISNAPSRKYESNESTKIQINQCESVDLISGSSQPIIIDPFCGSGNILLEALDMGFSVAGGDISGRAVSDTRANLEWFLNQNIEPNRHKSNPQIYTNDLNPKKLRSYLPEVATSLQAGDLKSIEVLDATKADFSKLLEAKEASEAREAVIVTEPYLGVPRKEKMSEGEARGEIEKLKPFYVDFLNNIYRQKDTINLKSMCVVFPLFELSNGRNKSLLEESIDEIRRIGYIVPCAPLKYGREYQVVKRQVVLLQLT